MKKFFQPQVKAKTLPHHLVPVPGTVTNPASSYLVFKQHSPKKDSDGITFKADIELIGTMEIAVTNKVPKHSARFLIQTAANLFNVDSFQIMTQKQGGQHEF
jgi:hypothetical protein